MKSKESSKAGLVNPPADPSGRNGTFALFSTPSAFKDESEGNCRRGAADDRSFPRFCAYFADRSTAGCNRRCRPSSQSLTSPPGATPQGASGSSIQAGAVPAGPTGQQINTAEITTRANHDVGVNIETTITGWQHELDRLESDLRGPRLRYSELNGFREELQRVRSGIEDFSNRLQSPLAAVKAQLDLLGQAPAPGQPPEAETVALNRAELNYQFGLLSAGQSAVHSANLRVDQLINSIQDIRRKNFTTNLFQPVPGIYSSQTWARLPDYVPSATSRARTLLVNWWEGVQDRDEVTFVVLEAILLWLMLTVAAWYGVRRLRNWRHVGEPPFWRRAASAAGVILLRILPVVAPIVFLYTKVAEAHALPERVDWIFYSAAQSTVIIFAVSALVTTVFAPAAANWRLIPASDRAAARICGLVLTLAIVYGLTTLIYAVTRIVQAPFVLTVAVALPSSLLVAGIVVAILLTPLQGERRDGMPSLRWLTALRIPAWFTVAAIVVSALAGYLALSRFLAQQLIVTGSILALVYLLLLWVDGISRGLSDESATAGRWLEQRIGLEQRRRKQLVLPVGLFLKFAVFVLSVPAASGLSLGTVTSTSSLAACAFNHRTTAHLRPPIKLRRWRDQPGVVPGRWCIGMAPCGYSGCKLVDYFPIEANSQRLSYYHFKQHITTSGTCFDRFAH